VAFLVAVLVVATWLARPRGDDARDGVGLFEGLTGLWSWAMPVGSAAAASRDETAPPGESTPSSRASGAARRPMLVEGLAEGPEGEVASFSPDRPRQVRQVRSSSDGSAERALGSRARDRRNVRERIQAAAPSIRQCYERRMRTQGHLRTTLVVEFTAQPNGRVSNVSIQSRAGGDRSLVQCVRSRLGAVHLGRGAVERYRVPLRLVPTEAC
jgi:hypothetical protein